MTTQGMRLVGLAAVLAVVGLVESAKADGPAPGEGPSPPNASKTDLYCSGATLSAPLFQKWFQEYKAKTGVQINYQTFGSSVGIKNVTARSVDFGAMDRPLNDAERVAAASLLQVPVVAGGVCVVYNVPGTPPHLRLTGDALARMYLGQITNWRDPALAALNPGVDFPDAPVTVWHLSSGSGVAKIFTTYLGQSSTGWKESVGSGSSVHWPVGLGDHGDLQSLRRGEGSVGYVDLAYAIRNNLACADLQNAKGKFVAPSVASMETAQETHLPPDFRTTLTDTSAPDGYPLTGFTYFLAYRQGAKPGVKDFLQWAVTEGQKDVAEFGYAPLTPAVQKRVLAEINTVH